MLCMARWLYTANTVISFTESQKLAEPAISGPGSRKANGPVLMQPSSISR